MARTSSIQFEEKSRRVAVKGECTTTNLRMDVGYETEGASGNPYSINGQVYRKGKNEYVGNFNVQYTDGTPSHSFNVGNNLDVIPELVQAISDLEAMIGGQNAE